MEKVSKKYSVILIIVAILAVVLRVYFAFNTDVLEYQFDTGILGKPLETIEEYQAIYDSYDEEPYKARHIHYIMKLYKENVLPDEIMGQFYHPPLHHFILATHLKFMDNFNLPEDIKLESMQLVTVIYSCITLFTTYQILKELEIDKKYKILPMILMAFYPLNIFLSGSINNDMLVLMFSSLALLYTIKWQKNPSMKNAFLLALWLGLGMMTKTSIVVMIVPAVYVYFKKLMEFINEDKKVGGLIAQLIVFSLVAGVLGLWFQIRSLLNGLNTIGIIQPYEDLSVAGYNLWERFGLANIFVMCGYNLWNYFVYSSLNFAIGYQYTLVEGIFAVFAAVLIIISIYYLFKYRKENEVLFITYITWWLSYLYLNISMPYSCSMNARYMLIPLIIGFVMIGKGFEKEKSKLIKGITILSTALVCIYSIVSFIFVF